MERPFTVITKGNPLTLMGPELKPGDKDLDFTFLNKDLRLLGRAVIVVDKNDKISYMELVPEVTEEPNYDEALKALKKTVG